MKTVAVAGGVHCIGDLLEIKRECLASLVCVVETMLDHESKTAANQRTGTRLTTRRHKSWHTLMSCGFKEIDVLLRQLGAQEKEDNGDMQKKLTLNVRDRAIELPDIPFEVQLVSLSPW